MGPSGGPRFDPPSPGPLRPSWDVREPAALSGRAESQRSTCSDRTGYPRRRDVLLAGLRHIEDHRLNCLAGIAPYEGKALERVHCYLFQLLAKTAIAASSVES